MQDDSTAMLLCYSAIPLFCATVAVLGLHECCYKAPSPIVGSLPPAGKHGALKITVANGTWRKRLLTTWTKSSPRCRWRNSAPGARFGGDRHHVRHSTKRGRWQWGSETPGDSLHMLQVGSFWCVRDSCVHGFAFLIRAWGNACSLSAVKIL